MHDGFNKESTILLYLCDRKQCGVRCHYPECKHTSDLRHAKNYDWRIPILSTSKFELIGTSSDNKKIFEEVEENTNDSV